ncbi:uncharacterized protein [Asterias amurensis]|uniref:uncharacterized protein n=1 Tax=Asterias amurensis TaxID=7602 RepID=UPI003AB7107D
MSCFCIRLQKDIVKTLDFRHCSLSFIPPEVYEYDETLEELCLDSNNIKELPRSLFHCQFLRKLSVCDNDLNSVPNAVASLVNLEQLDISKNGIVELPDSIKCCKNLSLVEISVNPLGKLPEGFTQLVNLTQLYLNDTLLDYLPANFGRLVKLTVLELRENRLKALPRSMSRLTELERLDLGMNSFRQVPEVIGFFTKLTELWVDSNKITSIPSSIGNLRELVYLDASCNRIETLPSEIQGLESLTDLHLSKNYLQELPDTVGQLSNLQSLKLDCNQLSFLPYSIGGLVSLEELILTSNDLEELPPSIGLLRKLSHLNLDQNMLLELPAELGSCSSISLLSLQSNFLLVLPDEIGHISNLCVFNLSNNQLRYLPYSTTKLKKLKAMWLSENQGKPLIPLQSEMKEDLGKRVLTCFLFPQQHREPGDDVYLSDGDSFHASVWDDQRLNSRQIAFDVSESDSEHNMKRAPTPYPKEGIKRKVRLPPTPSPSQGRQSRSTSKRDILPNYPSVDVSTRQGRQGGPREAKPRRSRSPGSPIADSLHLFQADKELMAKDKARLRGSISSVSRQDNDSESIASSTRERVVGRREMRAQTDRAAMSDSEAFIRSPVWSHTGGIDQNKQPGTPQNYNARPSRSGGKSHSRGYESDRVDGSRTPLMSSRRPQVQGEHARTPQSSKANYSRGYESDQIDGSRTPLMSARRPQVQSEHARTPKANYSRGYESECIESYHSPLEEYVRRQTTNRSETNRNSNVSVDGHQSAPRPVSHRRNSGYSTDPERRSRAPAESRESRMAEVKQKRDQMLPPPYHRVRQLRSGQEGSSQPNTPHRGNRRSQPQNVKDYGWIDGQLPSTPEDQVMDTSRHHGGELPGTRDGDRSNQPKESNPHNPSRRTPQGKTMPRASYPSAFSDTEVTSSRRRSKLHNQERSERAPAASNKPQIERTLQSDSERVSPVFNQNGPDSENPPRWDRTFLVNRRRTPPVSEDGQRMDGGDYQPRQGGQTDGGRASPYTTKENSDARSNARQPSFRHQDSQQQSAPRQGDTVSVEDATRHNPKTTDSQIYANSNTNSDYLNSLNDRRHTAAHSDNFPKNLNPRESRSLPRDVGSYQEHPKEAFKSDIGIHQRSSEEVGNRRSSPDETVSERHPHFRRGDKKKRLHGGAPDYAASEPELRQAFQNAKPTEPVPDQVNFRPPPPETRTLPFDNRRSSSQVLQNGARDFGRFPVGLPSSTPSVESGSRSQSPFDSRPQTPSDVQRRSRPNSPTNLPRSRPHSDHESYHPVNRQKDFRASNSFRPTKTSDRQYDSDYGYLRGSSMPRSTATPGNPYPTPHGIRPRESLNGPLTPIVPDTMNQDRRRILSSESDQTHSLGPSGHSSKVPWPDLWPQDSSGYASDQNEPGWKRGSCSTPTSSVFQGPSAPTSWKPGSEMTPDTRSRHPSSEHHQQGLTNKQLKVVIFKNPGLGFSITGGTEAHGNPFSPHDPGVFVTKIQPGGPADGVLKPGDKILEVNNRSYENISHEDAVKLLRKSNPVSMVINRRFNHS